ncbi:genetic competence negative regulator [Marinicrinis lubricantis]|uniref:Genetic competence negative regulator n=1 Tax=Marinicrinis lubricantis TaxID=2086470 RepID=A0ABW1ISI3_9BACL
MKIERLSQDKIRIFLTFEDLTERGIQKDDMWKEIPKVHDLFSEMMDQAYTELGFDATGPLAVEVFSLPAQGMVVIVTKGKGRHANDEDDLDDDDDVYEMEVTLDQSESITFVFQDFENVIQAAKSVQRHVVDAGSLYAFNDRWFLQFDPKTMDEEPLKSVIAILSEFGESSAVTTAVLEEYGKVVMAEHAVRRICDHF